MEQTYESRKKKVYEFICSDLYIPMKIKELAIMLQVTKEQRTILEKILSELIEEGKITLSKRGKYAKAEIDKRIGVFTAHAKGFGFVSTEGEEEDVFIPETKVNGAMHMDEVEILVHPSSGGKRLEGEVLHIRKRGMTKVVGTFETNGTFGFVVPDNARVGQDIFVAQEHTLGAVNGHKVVVELKSYGGNGKSPEGYVIEILGHRNDPGTDILSIVRAYDLPVEFSEKVLRQVENVAKPVSEADRNGRLDLREVTMVTIDGEDAKDLDDAVSLSMDGENYVLGVHIADVTNYVQENSALDVEAKNRGTSVYLVDRVIPMLPHALSNGICSLNQKEDRLALSCIMTINSKGKVIDYVIAESVICVDKRMSYTGVNRLLQPENTEESEYLPMLKNMEKLAAILRKNRRKRGFIDFDFPETKVILNEAGVPVDIRPYERNTATRIIEDFMLIANETVAQDAFWQELPFVYRTHEKPDAEKVQQLATFIQNFGYTIHIGTDEVHPKELQKLLDKIEGSNEEALISRLTLRSMKQARYSTQNKGHFGLAASYYCHFTSPIRRYPDLQIHRILKENLRGKLSESRLAHYNRILTEVANSSSKTEKRAEEAERETVKQKKVEFMENHLGEVYEGVISGVTEWGFFVELPNTVEGLVRISSLRDDYYEFVKERHELVGQTTQNRYKLGQKIKIVVSHTDRQMRTIDFELIQENDANTAK